MKTSEREQNLLEKRLPGLGRLNIGVNKDSFARYSYSRNVERQLKGSSVVDGSLLGRNFLFSAPTCPVVCEGCLAEKEL